MTGLPGLELVCPACRGVLERHGSDATDRLDCTNCGHSFPVVLGIPDLRLWSDPYVDPDQDHSKGRLLAELYGKMSFMRAVTLYYELTDRVPPFQAQRFAHSLAAAVPRSEHALRTWEREAGAQPDGRSLLDVGTGTAPLLQIAAHRYSRVAGVDIAFRWLVMARKRLEDAGIDAPLVCACAEALPFPDGSFDRVVADSAIEHMADQPRAMKECARVLGADGWFFAATPNRYSLGPDPHTGLPAGSLLPGRVSAAYVRLKGGIPPRRRLLSEASLRRLIEDSGLEVARVFLPDVAEAQRTGRGLPIRMAVDAYQLAKRVPLGSALLRHIAPLLHAVGHKPAVSACAPLPPPHEADPDVQSRA